MRGGRVTAGLPGRNRDATGAFHGKLGFGVACRGARWVIPARGAPEPGFFPHLDPVPATSRFIDRLRPDDIAAAFAAFGRAGVDTDPEAIPRIAPPVRGPDTPQFFAVVDSDGPLLRVP